MHQETRLLRGENVSGVHPKREGPAMTWSEGAAALLTFGIITFLLLV
jgi:hypothetical protein